MARLLAILGIFTIVSVLVAVQAPAIFGRLIATEPAARYELDPAIAVGVGLVAGVLAAGATALAPRLTGRKRVPR